jgi:hypothetical protein
VHACALPGPQFVQWGDPNPEFLIRVVSFKIFEVRGAKPTGFSMRIASKVKSAACLDPSVMELAKRQ